MVIDQRIAALRHLMRQNKIDYYYVSNSDPHQNEYLPVAWQRYQYISGFTGSNAQVLIGLDKAYFWTDGRYVEQAKIEVDPKLFTTTIYAQGSGASVPTFMSEHIKHARIGMDPQTITINEASQFKHAAQHGHNEIVFISENLIDATKSDQPPLIQNPITLLADRYTGETSAKKLKKLRNFINSENSDAIILNDLSMIAWLFNLRGNDVSHNPVFLSYALISKTDCILFVAEKALSGKASEYLKGLKVQIQPYTQFYQNISKFCPKRVLLEAKSSSQAILSALSKHEINLVTNPIHIWKACKNDKEIAGARTAHRIDAIALIRFFAWFEQHKDTQTELSVVDKLEEFRTQAKTYRGSSFTTIPGYGAHGAIIHYRATPETNVKIGTKALMLIDSGGQYLEGTTDITRTIHLGNPTALEKHCYTLVLKGHLALRHTVFAQGTRGEQLDIMARQFLWQEGYNYGHGTGHGVGAFLCVHEGPQRISTVTTTTPLYPNMILSNEPGVYLPGKFGIRIENLVYVKKAKVKDHGFGEFYTFDDLTLVPYARNLIDNSMLTETEIAQVNAYHNRILEELSSQLDVDALKWLIAATAPI